MAWWHFARATKMPTPGAMEYALLDNWQAVDPVIGPGIAFTTPMRNFAPQNAQATAQAVLTGLGGLVHGQSALQPLSNTYQGDAPVAYAWEDVNE